MKLYCCKYVTDKNTKRTRKCHTHIYSIFKNKPYCWNHFNQLYKTYAIKIQASYRSYRKRCIINNIYNKLPDELQYKICYYIHENKYIKKHNDAVKKIIERNMRYFNFYNFDEDYWGRLKKWSLNEDDFTPGEIIKIAKLSTKSIGTIYQNNCSANNILGQLVIKFTRLLYMFIDYLNNKNICFSDFIIYDKLNYYLISHKDREKTEEILDIIVSIYDYINGHYNYYNSLNYNGYAYYSSIYNLINRFKKIYDIYKIYKINNSIIE